MRIRLYKKIKINKKRFFGISKLSNKNANCNRSLNMTKAFYLNFNEKFSFKNCRKKFKFELFIKQIRIPSVRN